MQNILAQLEVVLVFEKQIALEEIIGHVNVQRHLDVLRAVMYPLTPDVAPQSLVVRVDLRLARVLREIIALIQIDCEVLDEKTIRFRAVDEELMNTRRQVSSVNIALARSEDL